MNNEHHFAPSQETEPKIEISKATTKEQIEEFFAFADPALGVTYDEAGPPEEYTPDFIVDHPEFTQVFVAKSPAGEIIGCAKVKNIDQRTQQRLGLDQTPLAHRRGVLLEYTVVRPDYKNQGVQKQLTEQRMQWGKDQGAEYFCAEAEINNPVSVYTKIRDGFVVTDVREPGEGIVHPYFVQIKQLEKQAPTPPDAQWQEVEVDENSYDKLKALFNHGWIGVDIKGAQEDLKNLSVPWVLVLEKRQS
jgi:GNAT superfamily N-acetyltransferase